VSAAGAEEIRGFTAALSRRIRETSWDCLSAEPDLVDRARQCILDWLGVAVAGSTEETTTILLGELAQMGGPAEGGGGTVVGHPGRLGVLDAALVNGTAGHALDYDDVNSALLGHPTAPVLPAVLALAEHVGADDRELLTAFVAGYEAECAVGRALGHDHYTRGFHTTATAGTLGAAAACSSLLGLTAGQTAVALGLASTQAAGLKSMFGTMAKPFHAGRAASAGILAARLAAAGFSAHPDAIEVEQGLGSTHSEGFDAERGLAPPAGGWHLRANLFKYHASCFQTHSSIEGLVRLREEAGFGVSDVAGVTIHADTMQMGMCAIPEPRTGLEVKFSLRHTAAFALAGVDSSAPSSFTDTAAADPELVALRDRITVVPDGTPGRPTVVEVALVDRRRLSAAHDVSVPEADLAVQGRRLKAKFQALTSPLLGAVGARTLADSVAGLGEGSDVGFVLAHSRPQAMPSARLP
jgi:2-methylcitrate dehydratase PrpD